MNIKERQIILIGPVCAGKTTLGKLVAEGLNKQSVSLDEKEAIPSDSYVIFLLPSPNLDKSVSIIREKCLKEREIDWNYDGYDFIEHWIKDKCNHILADKIIYTENKTAMESRDEILALFEHIH